MATSFNLPTIPTSFNLPTIEIPIEIPTAIQDVLNNLPSSLTDIITAGSFNVLINKIPSTQLNNLSLGAPVGGIPESVDLRSSCPPVYNQGQLGSCTANAAAGVFSIKNNNTFTPSRLFIYYNLRLVLNDLTKILWTAPTLAGPWTNSNTTTGLSQVIQLLDSSFAGINEFGYIVSSNALMGTWKVVNTNITNKFTTIKQLPNSTFIGTNNFNLVYSNTLQGPWITVINPSDSVGNKLTKWSVVS